MENPHKLIKEVTKLKWLWLNCKRDILVTTIASLALAIWIMIESPASWWAYGIILPLWYCLHLLRWHTLYKKNLQMYDNWEETFAGKSSIKK